MSVDPEVIRSVAISSHDLVTAIEANVRGRDRTVLRVTPPFSGRMRARLHVIQNKEDDQSIHIHPDSVLDESAPAYPTPDQTADEIRNAGDRTYSVETHREYHEQRVDQWRERLGTHVADSISISTTGHAVGVSILGSIPPDR
jgi:hypothetical protein